MYEETLSSYVRFEVTHRQNLPYPHLVGSLMMTYSKKPAITIRAITLKLPSLKSNNFTYFKGPAASRDRLNYDR